MFVINNRGYASIRETQRNYFEGRYVGTGPEARLGLPDLPELAGRSAGTRSSSRTPPTSNRASRARSATRAARCSSTCA